MLCLCLFVFRCTSIDSRIEFGLTSGDSKHHWRMWYALGTWRAGVNSGGSCANSGCRHGCYYWRNPQFVVELTVNRSHNANRLCMVIIALMQKPVTNPSAHEQYIQIRLFRIKPHVQISEKKIYRADEVERIASTGPYGICHSFFISFFSSTRDSLRPVVNRREVSLLLKTTTGAYLIIPSMADVDENCDFLLRVFSQDTTIGRTFVNIFAPDHHEDVSRRGLRQQYTISETTPSNVVSLLDVTIPSFDLVDVLYQITKSNDQHSTANLDEERINVIPIRPIQETLHAQRKLIR